ETTFTQPGTLTPSGSKSGSTSGRLIAILNGSETDNLANNLNLLEHAATNQFTHELTRAEFALRSVIEGDNGVVIQPTTPVCKVTRNRRIAMVPINPKQSNRQRPCFTQIFAADINQADQMKQSRLNHPTHKVTAINRAESPSQRSNERVMRVHGI